MALEGEDHGGDGVRRGEGDADVLVLAGLLWHLVVKLLNGGRQVARGVERDPRLGARL